MTRAKSLLESCWTPEPIATLDVRRSPDTVCTIQFLDPRGRVRSASGRVARRPHGGSIDLFRSGVLALLLGCCTQTIYGLEERYGFPWPKWNVTRPNGAPLSSRLYSRRQLYAIGVLHRHFGFLRSPFRERAADFAFAVSLVFDDVDRIPSDDVRGLIAAALLLGREEIGQPGHLAAATDRADHARGDRGGWGPEAARAGIPHRV